MAVYRDKVRKTPGCRIKNRCLRFIVRLVLHKMARIKMVRTRVLCKSRLMDVS